MSGIRISVILWAPVLCLLISLSVTESSLAQQQKETPATKATKAAPDTEKQEQGKQEEQGTKPPTTQELTWQTLAPEDSGFSIELPGKAQHAERKLKPLPDMEVDVDMYLLSIERGKVAIVVGYHDVQEMPTTDQKRREILDGGIKGTLVNVLGKLKSHERGEFEGHKMRDFAYTGVRGQRDIAGVSKLILVNQRVYQLSIIHLAETSVDQEIQERFFSSFKLVK